MLVGSTPSLKSSSNAYSANTLILLGLDISNLPKHQQYLICAGGVFFFTLIYGFFQELVVVKVFDRQLPLFLAFCQFAGYTCSSAVVHLFVNKTGSVAQLKKSIRTVPYHQFFGMAALRSFDLGMTNSSMR
jgi:adenosine 3'-phospho 5'-phosphosulfate transporter B3